MYGNIHVIIYFYMYGLTLKKCGLILKKWNEVVKSYRKSCMKKLHEKVTRKSCVKMLHEKLAFLVNLIVRVS